MQGAAVAIERGMAEVGGAAKAEGARPRYLEALAFNPERGELVAPNGDDLVVMNRVPFATVFGSLREILGSGGNVIWHNAGVRSGEAEGRRLKKLTTKQSPEEFLLLITDFYTNLGWGKSTFVGLKEGSVTIATKNNPLVRGVRSKEPVCHFIGGFYKGFCAEVFKSDHVTVEETSCEATGAGHCEFRIRW